MRKTSTNYRTSTTMLLILAVVLSSCFAACGQKSDTAQQSATSPTPAVAATTTPVAGATPVGATSPAASPTAEASPQTATAAPPPTTAAPTPPPPKPLVIPAGTVLKVRTSSTISTKTAKTGEKFVASLESPVSVGGKVVAKAGAAVNGTVVNSDPGGRVKGVALITVNLTSLTLANGNTVAISTNVIERQAKSTKKKDAGRIGIGAGAGALIGGIAGGGKGAAIGAGVGTGAGTAVTLATRGDPAVISSESLLSFTLRSAVTVK